jgi:hypothetical protein
MWCTWKRFKSNRPKLYVIECAEYQPVSIITTADADPHPFADAGGFVSEFDFDVSMCSFGPPALIFGGRPPQGQSLPT